MPALINGPTLGLKGRYRFHVLHPDTGKPILGRDGVPIYRDASGFVRRADIWHPNLITNRGMDQIADETFSLISGVRYYLKVGTGATAPDVADAALASYVGQSVDNGANNGQYSVEFDDSGSPLYRFSGKRHAVYTAGGAVTLAEFGFDHHSGDYAGIRELLRDEVGDPTTVSLEAGQQLGVEHDAIVEFAQSVPVSFDIVEKNLAGTTVDTQSYTGTLYTVLKETSSSYPGYLEPSHHMRTHNFNDVAFCSELDATFTPGLGTAHDVDVTSPYMYGSLTDHAYVSGSHQRLYTLGLSASVILTGGVGIKMVLLGFETGGDLDVGTALFLDDPQAIPKALDKRLDLSYRVSWARI